VGGQERVRYSGSPLPLSMAEASYRHQVLLVDLDGERLAGVRSVGVPRSVEVLRVPVTGALPLPEVVALLRELPSRPPSLPEGERPYLEVCVALERPEPGLRRQVEEALEGRAPRLVKLTVEHAGHGRTLAESAAAARDLKDLSPEEVFRSRYSRSHEGDPPPELLAAFHELVDLVGQGAGSGGPP